MFDRIGRIDDETPFVVEWFAKHGIEVLSTQEGRQCFNSYVDKLMSMIDDMTIHKVYGSYQMADFLNKNSNDLFDEAIG